MDKFCNHGLVMLDIFGCQDTFILRLVYLLLTLPFLVEKHFFFFIKSSKTLESINHIFHIMNYSPFLNSWIFPSVVDRCVDFFFCHLIVVTLMMTSFLPHTSFFYSIRSPQCGVLKSKTFKLIA